MAPAAGPAAAEWWVRAVLCEFFHCRFFQFSAASELTTAVDNGSERARMTVARPHRVDNLLTRARGTTVPGAWLGRKKKPAPPPPSDGKTPETRAAGGFEVKVTGPKDEYEAASGAYAFWEKNGKATMKKPKKLTQRQLRAHETIKATMKATLGGGDLRETVKLPEGEDKKEWIAVNTVHFYNAASMIYGTISEDCAEDKPECRIMSAGPKYEYLWQDGIEYKKPTKMSAPEYIDNLLTWAGEQIADPKLFPVDPGARFPHGFMKQVRVIYKRLFRVYGHIYHVHFDKIKSLGANGELLLLYLSRRFSAHLQPFAPFAAHLNTCFKHFIFFIKEFSLVKDSDVSTKSHCYPPPSHRLHNAQP